MNVYVLDIAPLRVREREALALLPEERREKALRIRREGARLRSIGASLLLRADGSRTYKDVIELMAAIRRSGFEDVTLVTAQEGR